MRRNETRKMWMRWTVTKTQPQLVLVECAHNLIYARCFLLLYFYNEQTRADRRHDVCYWSNKLLSFLSFLSFLPFLIYYFMKIRFGHEKFLHKNTATRSLLCVPNCQHRWLRIWMADAAAGRTAHMSVSQHILFKCFFVSFLLFLFHSPNLFCCCSTT